MGEVPLSILRHVSPVSICEKDEVIHFRRWFRRQSIPLASLQKVEYAYHAVVGFVAVWCFTGESGEEIVVGEHCPGLRRLLKTLEQKLPPFSLAEWQRQFDEGDVEDTLVVWERAAQHPT